MHTIGSPLLVYLVHREKWIHKIITKHCRGEYDVWDVLDSARHNTVCLCRHQVACPPTETIIQYIFWIQL